MSSKRKVFISYHHKNDQYYKNELVRLSNEYGVFIDYSVDTGEIDDSLDDQAIRQKIRDEYLKESSVTILLVGTETKKRKHIDWEIYSSMFDGQRNKKSGILVINLPSVNCTYYSVGHGQVEKDKLYPEVSGWTTLDRTGYEERYPYLPKRIIDNLVKGTAKISVANWNTLVGDISKLKTLIELTAADREKCDYDLSSPLRRSNS